MTVFSTKFTWFIKLLVAQNITGIILRAEDKTHPATVRSACCQVSAAVQQDHRAASVTCSYITLQITCYTTAKVAHFKINLFQLQSDLKYRVFTLHFHYSSLVSLCPAYFLNCSINCDLKPQTFISIFKPDSRSLKESRAKHVNYINCGSKTTTSSSTPSLPLWCWEAAGAMEGKAQRIMGEWAKTQGGSRQMKWSGNDDDDDDVCGLKEQFTTNENHFMSVQIKTDA